MKTMVTHRTLITQVLIVGLLWGVTTEAKVIPGKVNPSPVVDIPGLGKVVGTTGISHFSKREYFSYKGIRYAVSPSGSRRFQPPEPSGPWNGTFEATHFGQKCPQTGIFRDARTKLRGWDALEVAVEEELIKRGEISPKANREKDIEDCLFVHIYTPKVGVDAKLPVMIFFHGGAYAGGSALVYGAQRLMDKDVVLVVPHYRLGPLGFLSLQTDDIAGNAGLLDQVLALEWVRDHISVFGGDPNLVTIFGESAGGASVGYLLLSPLARGLFHRVIGESGSSLAAWAIDDIPEFHTVNIAAEAGCNVTGADSGKGDLTEVTRCLQTVDAMKLTRAYQTYKAKEERRGYSGFGGCSPIVQRAGKKKYIDKHPLDILKSGNYSNVPVMFGANKNEGTYVMAIVYGGYMVPNGLENDKNFLRYGVPDSAFRLFNLEDPNYWLTDSLLGQFLNPDIMGNFIEMCPGMIDVLGSVFLKGPQHRLVQLHSKRNNSYLYAFDYEGKTSMWSAIGDPSAPFDGGVCHANDLLYLFSIPLFDLNEEDDQLSKKMVGVWTNFAYYGEPNPDKSKIEGVPEWKPYHYGDEFYMRIDKELIGLRDFTQEYTMSIKEGKICHKQ
ncbi:juvenile hormone esterase-like [Ischnura elegans]|uniref:juvenile hormone esterase-like n=1 Tax=Ischnura elegans TaxID=197161 RepID=UPI001ED87247|nr:juvenile hormone esterase-like [Ischnura elegans]